MLEEKIGLSERQKFQEGTEYTLMDMNRVLKDKSTTIDDLLLSLIQGIKKMGITLNARFYKVEGITSDIYDFLKKREEGQDIDPDQALYWLHDTRTNPTEKPDMERYLAIRSGTTTGDSFYGNMPVVAASNMPKPEDRLVNVCYSTDLGKGRFVPLIANRASFPIMNLNDGEVAYVLVVDKVIENEDGSLIDKSFHDYELAAVKNLVQYAASNISSKKEVKSYREILHEISSPMIAARKIAEGFLRKAGSMELSMIQKYVRHIDSSLRAPERIFNRWRNNESEMISSTIKLDKFLESNFGVGKINEKYDILYPEIDIRYASNVKVSEWIACDEILIHSMFRNMFDNSVETYKENFRSGNLKRALDIRLDAKIDTDPGLGQSHIIISYRDTAGGMSDKVYDLVWKSIAAHTTKEYGKGLGVNRIKEICEKHGWNIDMKNDLGKGINYEIRIPLKD